MGQGGTGVVRTDVSRRRNGSATIGARTGALSLAIEERRAVVSGGWNQLRQCCKGARYLCQSIKVIKIDCTQIGTNT